MDALKVLADRSRLKLLRALLGEAMSVGELAGAAGVSPYNASKHLRILRSARMVEMTRNGARREYTIAEGLRRRIDQEQVLDLGCCAFRLRQLEE